MCGVVKAQKVQGVDLYSLLGKQNVTTMVRHGRLRWFGHLEHKGVND